MGGRGRVRGGGGGQGGCDLRNKVFGKIHTKKNIFFGGEGGGSGSGWWGGVRVDVNEELKFLDFFFFFLGGGGPVGGGGGGGQGM